METLTAAERSDLIYLLDALKAAPDKSKRLFQLAENSARTSAYVNVIKRIQAGEHDLYILGLL